MRLAKQVAKGQTQAKEGDLGITSHWIEVDGLRIHYKEFGEGPPVIFLHGGANDWHEWENNIASFADHFHVYALDLPGFGLSSPANGPISPFWFSSFLKNFINALGITDAHLVSHSLGGSIVLSFAIAFPGKLKKAILIDSTGFGQASLKGRVLLFLIRTIKRMLGKEKSPKLRGIQAEDWLTIGGLEGIKSSVLLVWGERDPYLPLAQARMAQRRLPDCRLHVFKNGRHAPHREFAKEFNELSVRFLM